MNFEFKYSGQVLYNPDLTSVTNSYITSAGASYLDTVYTEVSPFNITAGSWYSLPNNAGTTNETQLNGNSSFYDGTKIRGNAINDYYLLSIRLRGKASLTNTSIIFGIDIGGTQGIFIQDQRLFTFDAGTEQPLSTTLFYFTRATFLANGGIVKVKAVNGDIDLYSISYVFSKIHKAL